MIRPNPVFYSVGCCCSVGPVSLLIAPHAHKIRTESNSNLLLVQLTFNKI